MTTLKYAVVRVDFDPEVEADVVSQETIIRVFFEGELARAKKFCAEKTARAKGLWHAPRFEIVRVEAL